MGKKAKKKARSAQRDKKVSTASSVSVHDDQNPILEAVKNATPVVLERKGCAHLDKSMDLTEVSSKLESVEAFRCEDCRGGMVDRKGKGKNGKTKGNNSKAIWVCLECGHFGCGGIGLPTTPQSHAVRHARQNRHSLAIQIENPSLRWCFPCSTLIPPEKIDGSGEKKDLLFDVVKLIKKEPPNGTIVDVEDVWFGSGSVLSEAKSEKILDFYAVRGLSNLGNTCFFNSVLQNLLAMDKLQDYLLKLDDCSGPLTNSLKKLYVEVNSEAGVRNVLSPKSLFGSICSRAPQFRGYQQQDSHELLRCLLDGLSTEDLRAKKMGDKSSDVGASFVDVIFGGQLSSTVCCAECDHSSVVYEPFLDLSLPVPTKKPPPKKAKAVSRKIKPPPRRVATKSRPKHAKNVISAPIADPRPSSDSSNGFEPKAITSEGTGDSLDGSSSVHPPSQQAVSFDETSWMDYLEPTAVEEEIDPSFQSDEYPANKESDSVHQDDLNANQSSVTAETTHDDAIHQDLQPFESDSYLRSLEDEIPMQVGDSQILLLPYKEETTDVGENNMERAIEPSSSVVGNGEDFSSFDGFADMFNEPDEISIGCSVKPDMENGFATVNNSGSEPGEVDDTDSPVSIESCLSHFTKPELLSDECSWHCVNCTKILLEEKKKSRKNKPNGLNNGFSRSNNGSADSSIYQICNGSALSDDKTSGSSEDVDWANGKVEERAEDEELGESDEEMDSKSVKVMRDATKRYLISKLPPILTVHLKRFSQDGRGRLSKLNGHVAFKEIVDLKQYVDSRCLERQEECKYRLSGVVEHLGSMRGGHYIAYVRGGARRRGEEAEANRKSVWYYASDAHVRETTLEDVLRCEAYILFYEKV